jgi:hypothetical protein
LGQNDFSDEALFGSIDKPVTKFNTQYIFKRESMIWTQEHGDHNHLFMITWLKRRLVFLDEHFARLDIHFLNKNVAPNL